MRIGHLLSFVHNSVLVMPFIFLSINIAEGKIVNGIESTDYQIDIAARYCAVSIYVNDISVISNDSGKQVSALVGIGEYLKRTGNTIRVDVWDPSREDEAFTPDSYCHISLKARDRFESVNLDLVGEINFRPSDKASFNTSEKAFIDTVVTNTHWGKATSPSQAVYLADKKYYQLTRNFDIRSDYPVWMWDKSPDLVSKNETFESLHPEKIERLKAAYTEFWQALNSGDLEQIKALNKELISESITANGGSEEFFFKYMGFIELYNSEDFADYKLMPLDFSKSKIKFHLDKKLVSFSDTPIRFERQNDPDGNYTEFNPKFRLAGDKFVIAR